jgi:hypothetical protein
MPTKVTLHRVENANEPQTRILERASVAVRVAVNHPDFRTRVINTQFPEALFRPKGGTPVTKSSAEVARIILEGIERDQRADAQGRHDREIDVAIRLDNISRPTVGSTTPGRLPFRTAYWFVDQAVRRNDTVSPARHIIHEWLHVAGFVHKRNDGPRRDVPYMVGDIVRQILRGNNKVVEKRDQHHEDPDLALELDSAEEELMISSEDWLDDLRALGFEPTEG